MENTGKNMAASPNVTFAENKSYTILRIKRKRNEEPLDALVVESRVRRKKSRGGIGVFQYAQTVENDVWDNANRQKDIQAEISRMALEWKAISTIEPPTNDSTVPSPVPRPTKDGLARRYTIVENEVVNPPSRRYPTAPPKVLSAKELENIKATRDFKMYDAVPASQRSSSLESSEVDKFLPMLTDYLKLHDTDSSPKKITGIDTSQTNENDYVWDVFYHRPVTLSEWNEIATNVGTVTGLPPSFGDGYDSTSDSEEELDEADEDSNAEEYYKNDYPEDENSSNSDQFHEDSDYEDMMHYR